MSKSPLLPVPFHGDTIYCVEIDGQPYTPAKPIVENLGLAWQVQARKLAENSDRWGITMMVIPTSSGAQETLCIPVRKLPAFLASINPKKVKPELRSKIELYQAECDDALWAYWSKGHAERQAALPVAAARLSLSTIEERRPLGELVKEWARVTGMLTGKAWGKINTHFGLRQVGDLPREMLPEAEAFVQAQIDAFRRAMEMTMPESTASSPENVLIPEPGPEFVRGARPVSRGRPAAARLALPAGRDQVDLGAVDAVLRRAEDLCVSYNLTIRELVEELRAPFGAARQDNHLQEPVRSFATSVLYGISDLQTACSVVHNATLNAVRMAVDGCRILETSR